MSRISELAVAKRSVTLLLAGALFVAGISAWGSLKQELLPDIEFPVITVVASYPGTGATDVADEVAVPIERAISGVPRLESLQSTSANSVALVIAQFSFGTDVKEALAAVEDNIDAAGLPESVAPVIQSLNINASPVIIASIVATDEEGLDEAAEIARAEIVPEIQSLQGVARADLTGGRESQILVTLDSDELAETGISVQQVTGVLQANNITLPSGQVPGEGQRIPVSTSGTIGSIDELEALVVGVRQASASPPAAPSPPEPVTLAEIATIEQALVASTGDSRTDGNPSLTLTVTKTVAANTVLVAEAVEDKLAELAADHPGELTIVTVSDLSSFIIESRDGLLREGGLGAVFAIVTIFLFLSSLRSTFVAAISIPLSVLTALVVMQLTGITINVMTLGGLAVAVGRVVDDAIVVLENIYRHRALGEDRLAAVLAGPREVASAITASTLTTVGVFLPLGFVGGLVTQFFLPFALTVTFALLASLVVALTVVPVLAYLFIDRVTLAVDETGEPKNSLWVHAYAPTIRFVLGRGLTRWGVLAIAAAMFVGSLSLVPLLPTTFISAGSEKILQVTLAPPAATSSEAVLERAVQAEEILTGPSLPEVRLVQTSVPSESDTTFQTILAALNGRPANSATINVQLSPDVDLGEASRKLSEALEPIKTDGFDVAVAEAAGFTSNNLQIVVSGPRSGVVEEATDAVVAALAERDDLGNLRSDLVKATPEVQITVDAQAAGEVGLSAAQVAGEVRLALVPTPATSIALEEDVATTVVVRLDPEAVASVEDLRELLVGTTVKVPLESIATVEQVDTQGSITRIDESPAASITAEILSGDTGATSADVQAIVDELVASGQVPAGVAVTLAGVTQQQSEAFGGLYASMAVAILLVYVMMVLAFNSLVTPFIILFSLPLATVGAFPALLVTGRPIGVSALIGFLMLIGIVVTNAIVLLDLVERLRSRGLSTHDALVEGGKIRVRPILMTAIATILALIPLAAGFNEGSIIAAELGTVVIGGLLSSTFLTLLVVPVAYSLVDAAKARVRWGREPEPAAAEG